MPEPSVRKGSPVIQFSLMLENQAGALSSLVNLLHESHIDVLGLSLTDSAEVTLARIVVTDPDLVMQLFLEKGIPHAMIEVVVVELRQGAAGLHHCLRAILETDSNIHYSYPLFVQTEEGFPLLAFYLDDSEYAAALLEQQGFHTVCQEDLSR